MDVHLIRQHCPFVHYRLNVSSEQDALGRYMQAERECLPFNLTAIQILHFDQFYCKICARYTTLPM